MSTVSKFSESVWRREEEKFKRLQTRIKIPNKHLHHVDSVVPKKESDFNRVPATGGCYWIWTNEPVRHRFHRNMIPDKIRNGELIYNGIAKEDVQQRIKHHLLGNMDAGWSGISLDLYPGEAKSHKKKVWSRRPRAKLPYIDTLSPGPRWKQGNECEPLRDRNLIFKLYLTKREKDFVKNSNKTAYYFRNGIDIFDKKHIRFAFRIYFIVGLESLYLEYVEKKWREELGLPRLCSY